MNSYFGDRKIMAGGGMYGKDVYNPNSPDYGDYSRPDNYTPGKSDEGANDTGAGKRGGTFVDTDKDGVDDNQPQMGDMSNPKFRFNNRNESGNDNQDANQIQQGLGNFGGMMDEFFKPADKEDTARSGLQLGLAADFIGKYGDNAMSKDMANFQSGMYKDNSKFGADLQYDFDSKTRADEFGYGMRSMDKQFNLQDEFQNRQYGRNIGMEGAKGEQRRKDLKEAGAQGRETYDFQDTVDARGEERDRSRSSRLSRSF